MVLSGTTTFQQVAWEGRNQGRRRTQQQATVEVPQRTTRCTPRPTTVLAAAVVHHHQDKRHMQLRSMAVVAAVQGIRTRMQ